MRTLLLLCSCLPAAYSITFIDGPEGNRPGDSSIITWDRDPSDPDSFFLCLGPVDATGPYTCTPSEIRTGSRKSPFTLPNVEAGFYRLFATTTDTNISVADVFGSSDRFLMLGALGKSSQTSSSFQASQTSTSTSLSLTSHSIATPPSESASSSSNPSTAFFTSITSSKASSDGSELHTSDSSPSVFSPTPTTSMTPSTSPRPGMRNAAVFAVIGVIGVAGLLAAMVALLCYRRRKRKRISDRIVTPFRISTVSPSTSSTYSKEGIKADRNRLQEGVEDPPVDGPDNGVERGASLSTNVVSRQLELLREEISRIVMHNGSLRPAGVNERPPPYGHA